MTAANKDFFEALSMLEHERGITAEYLIEKIKAAIIIAVKKNYEVEEDHIPKPVRRNRSFLSLSALGLQTLLFAFSCMCCVDIPGVCFGDGFCFDTAFAALVSFLLSCAKFTRRVYSSFFLC